MATSILGNQKFKPKTIADKAFIMNTNMDQKMIGEGRQGLISFEMNI